MVLIPSIKFKVTSGGQSSVTSWEEKVVKIAPGRQKPKYITVTAAPFIEIH